MSKYIIFFVFGSNIFFLTQTHAIQELSPKYKVIEKKLSKKNTPRQTHPTLRYPAHVGDKTPKQNINAPDENLETLSSDIQKGNKTPSTIEIDFGIYGGGALINSFNSTIENMRNLVGDNKFLFFGFEGGVALDEGFSIDVDFMYGDTKKYSLTNPTMTSSTVLASDISLYGGFLYANRWFNYVEGGVFGSPMRLKIGLGAGYLGIFESGLDQSLTTNTSVTQLGPALGLGMISNYDPLQVRIFADIMPWDLLNTLSVDTQGFPNQSGAPLSQGIYRGVLDLLYTFDKGYFVGLKTFVWIAPFQTPSSIQTITETGPVAGEGIGGISIMLFGSEIY